MAQELKAIRGGDIHDLVEFGDGSEIYHDETLYYLKNVADEALAEKDAEIRRLQRALWLERAERATVKQAYYDVLSRGISSERGEMYDVWNNVERKCRAKAEQYK